MNLLGVDWKVWLVGGLLSVGLLGEILRLSLCNWIPSDHGRAICGEVATDMQQLGGVAPLFASAADAGAP